MAILVKYEFARNFERPPSHPALCRQRVHLRGCKWKRFSSAPLNKYHPIVRAGGRVSLQSLCSRLYIRFSGFRLVRPFFWGSVGGASDPKGSRYKFLLNRTFFALLWYSNELFISALDCSKWIDSRQDASATRLILVVLGYMSSRRRVQQFIDCGAPYDLKYNASDGRRPEN